MKQISFQRCFIIHNMEGTIHELYKVDTNHGKKIKNTIKNVTTKSQQKILMFKVWFRNTQCKNLLKLA